MFVYAVSHGKKENLSRPKPECASDYKKKKKNRKSKSAKKIAVVAFSCKYICNRAIKRLGCSCSYLDLRGNWVLQLNCRRSVKKQYCNNLLSCTLQSSWPPSLTLPLCNYLLVMGADQLKKGWAFRSCFFEEHIHYWFHLHLTPSLESTMPHSSININHFKISVSHKDIIWNSILFAVCDCRYTLNYCNVYCIFAVTECSHHVPSVTSQSVKLS